MRIEGPGVCPSQRRDIICVGSGSDQQAGFVGQSGLCLELTDWSQCRVVQWGVKTCLGSGKAGARDYLQVLEEKVEVHTV